jgi:predicted secreted protein
MTIMGFALLDEISAFEVGRQADDVEGAIRGFRHFVFSFQRCDDAAKVSTDRISQRQINPSNHVNPAKS